MAQSKNSRINPRDGSVAYNTITGEAHTVEFHTDKQLYGVYAIEAIKSGSLTVTDTGTGGGPITVVTSHAPVAGECWPDVRNGTGWIEFNAAENGRPVELDYQGAGYAGSQGNLEDLVAAGLINIRGLNTGRIVKNGTSVDILPGAYHVNGSMVDLIAIESVALSGGAGWRYILLDDQGNGYSETIPVAEITADTAVYTPSPVFDNADAGYYSTVNVTRRIIGVAYWDAAAIDHIISYGSGRQKNDNELNLNTLNGHGSSGTKIPRYTNAPKIWGADYTYSDSATNGMSITFNRSGFVSAGTSWRAHDSSNGISGFSLNASSLSTTIFSLAVGEIVSYSATAASYAGNSSALIRVNPGDILRVHTDGTATATSPELCSVKMIFMPD